LPIGNALNKQQTGIGRAISPACNTRLRHAQGFCCFALGAKKLDYIRRFHAQHYRGCDMNCKRFDIAMPIDFFYRAAIIMQ